MAEINFEKTIDEIAVRVEDKCDEFIFSVLSKYVKKDCKLTVNKEELKSAVVRIKGRRVKIIDGKDFCPRCFKALGPDTQGMTECYCSNCGQRILRCWNE